MPWRNQPEWIQVLMAFVSFAIVAGIGVMAKIADEVKSGDREKFWTAKLWLEVPTLCLMGAISYGVVSHFALPLPAAVGFAAALGWLGPKIIDQIVINRMGSPSKEKSKD